MSGYEEQLAAQFESYAAQATDEKDTAVAFIDLLMSGPHVFTREHLGAHFTGSAWLVSADGARALLTHHRKLDRWLQLGGHADGDVNLSNVALREAQEESGLADLTVEPLPFDLDRHRIPARPGEPEHWHYDVRYVVRAGDDEAFAVSEESHALAWRNIDQLAEDPTLDPSIQRMARKWLDRKSSATES